MRGRLVGNAHCDGYAITGFASFEQPVANFDATRRQLAIRAFVLRVDSVH
jgi:hypothetical protein